MLCLAQMALIAKNITLILILEAEVFLLQAPERISPEESFYIFKSDWSGAARIEEAVYFAKVTKAANTCWQWDVYNYFGPMIKSEHYKDAKLMQLHGR